MKMTINDALIRYNILASLKYKDGDYSLPRDLKIKLIKCKIALEKIFNDFNAFQEKCLSELKTDEYNDLVSIEEDKRTDEQKTRLTEVVNSLNQEMNELLFNKSMEEVDVHEFEYLSDEDFNSVLEVNVENEVTINGRTIDGGAYVDLIHQAFTTKEEEKVEEEDSDDEAGPSEVEE